MNYGNAMQGQAGTAQDNPSQVRESQVQNQVQRSAKLTLNLEQLVRRLHDRLEPVLSSVSGLNQKSGETSPARPTLVGHATSLSNHNDQLEILSAALQDIINRIEL